MRDSRVVDSHYSCMIICHEYYVSYVPFYLERILQGYSFCFTNHTFSVFIAWPGVSGSIS